MGRNFNKKFKFKKNPKNYFHFRRKNLIDTNIIIKNRKSLMLDINNIIKVSNSSPIKSIFDDFFDDLLK